jgi:hypothetical protein
MTVTAWVPGWYELDPPLEVGLADRFAFWRIVPEHLRGPEPLVLYNTLWHPEDAMVARGTIAAIRHPELGEVRKVDTRGLDYTLTLADGTELLVNAEEEPGKIFERAGAQWAESSRVVTDWRFVVQFAALGEPQPAEQGRTAD